MKTQKIMLSPDIWERIFSSPILEQTIALLAQIFKRGFGLTAINEMGIPQEDFLRIRKSCAEYARDPSTKKLIRFPFCDLINARKTGSQRCCRDVEAMSHIASDTRQPCLKPCHAGLVDILAPIIIQGNCYGYFTIQGGLLMTQPNEQEWQKISQSIQDTGVDLELLKKAYFQIAPVSQELLEVMLKLLNVIMEEIAKMASERVSDKELINELKINLNQRYHFGNIIGKSKVMQELFSLIEKVAESDSTVLIQGESGTGKELVARAIHYNSPRKTKPFVIQNCSAFSEQLLESEFFGHVEGSFTGAIKDKQGLFEIADGGTFFLDEVSEMSSALQVKLLRVIQEGTFIPVGGTVPKKVDVRLVAATNKNLKQSVGEGKFREDLYYRLDVIRITIPPLRERKEDVPLLIQHFLQLNHKHNIEISPEVMKFLLGYDWPGNVRELQNEVERFLVLGGNHKIIKEEFLSENIRQDISNIAFLNSNMSNLNNTMEELEKGIILKSLERCHWNRTKTAKGFGISLRTLLRKISYYKITRS